MYIIKAFYHQHDDPIYSAGEKIHWVALSDHADFEGTIEYVKGTGAKRVMLDRRNGHPDELADELRAAANVEIIHPSN